MVCFAQPRRNEGRERLLCYDFMMAWMESWSTVSGIILTFLIRKQLIPLFLKYHYFSWPWSSRFASYSGVNSEFLPEARAKGQEYY